MPQVNDTSWTLFSFFFLIYMFIFLNLTSNFKFNLKKKYLVNFNFFIMI